MWCSSYGVCSRFCPQTVLSSGICLVAGYVIPYLPSEGQCGRQPCGGPGAVEKPCWGPAFTPGCRLPLCSAQPLPPQLLTDLPHCVLRWFVLASARITFLWWLSTVWICMTFFMVWKALLQGLSHFPYCEDCMLTFWSFVWLSKSWLTQFCLACWLYWLAWLGARHTMPSWDFSFWEYTLCSPWKKMFERSCAENSTSGHSEYFETSTNRLNAKYILCWFLSLQASELEDTCSVSCCGEILFMYIFLIVLIITLWNYFKAGSEKEKRVDYKTVSTRNFNLVLSMCFFVDIYIT